MAIRAHQFALRNFFTCKPDRRRRHQGRDVCPLCGARQVVERHGRRVEPTAAISAGLGLERSHPGHQLSFAATLAGDQVDTPLLVVRRVVCFAARLAPVEITIASAMKFGYVLSLIAKPAAPELEGSPALFHLVIIEQAFYNCNQEGKMKMVGVERFELSTSDSRSQRSTKLSHTPPNLAHSSRITWSRPRVLNPRHPSGRSIAGEVPLIDRPETRYAHSGEVMVAYQVTGDGPIDFVGTPGTVSNLDVDWEGSVLTERIASFSRLIRFDKRGTGMSDRGVHAATLEERTDDIRAVMDATLGSSMSWRNAALPPST